MFTNNQSNIIALTVNGQQFTYADIYNKANAIASTLLDNNLKQDDIITMHLPYGYDLICSILAIWKIGAAYYQAPVYATNEVLASTMLSVNSRVVLTVNENVIGTAQNINVKRIKGEAVNSDFEIIPNTIVSVLPKSISTALESTAVLSIEKLRNWLDFTKNALKIDFGNLLILDSERTTVNFPIWINALNGNDRINVIDSIKKGTKVSEILETLENINTTALVCDLGELQLIIENSSNFNSLKKLHHIVTIGEQCFDSTEFKAFLKENNTKWYNLYGFPEIGMMTTPYKDESDAIYHIGKQFINTQSFVLNSEGKICTLNTYGALHTNNTGILTYKSDSIQTEYAEDQLINTGYIARLNDKGFFSFRVEQPNMITINGYRIDVKYLSTLILNSGFVHDVYCYSNNKSGEDDLIAYLIPNAEYSEKKLQVYLQNYLPNASLPICIAEVLILPYTNEGEVAVEQLLKEAIVNTTIIKTIEEAVNDIPEISEAAVKAYNQFKVEETFHIWDIPVSQSKYLKEEHNNLIDNNSVTDENLLDALLIGEPLPKDDNAPKQLSDILLVTAQNHAEKTIICIDEKGERISLQYQELLEKAKRVAEALKAQGVKPKDKVILQFVSLEQYFQAFWGCQLLGAITVPFGVPKSYGKNNDTDTLLGIWEMLDRPYFLSFKDNEHNLKELHNEFQILSLETITGNNVLQEIHRCDPKDTAVILFTSGSTGLPKGVTQSHQNIIDRTRSSIDFHDLKNTEITVNWLPVEHVVGLFMFHIKEVYLGCKQIHIKANYIMGDMLRWLDLLSEYKATVTWAPNFAFGIVADLVVKETSRTWDFSNLRININAGETLTEDSSKRFLKVLEKYNMGYNVMQPEWGMSETCSAILASTNLNTKDKAGVIYIKKESLTGILEVSEDKNEAISFVDLGRVYKGISLRIVDQSNIIVKERRIGKLQVKGVCITPGYYKNDKVNKEVFVGDGWFDTGDLAFIYDRGVYFAGRTKNIIVINGINYSNIEIETTVEQLENIEKTFVIACTVKDRITYEERLAIFYNSQLEDPTEIAKQISEIRSYVMQKVGVNTDYIVPISQDDIPKTSIGKLQRSKMSTEFELGVFDEIIKTYDKIQNNDKVIPQWFDSLEWQPKQLKNQKIIDNKHALIIFEDEVLLSTPLATTLKAEGYLNVIEVQHKETFDFSNAIQWIELFNQVKIKIAEEVTLDIFYISKYNSKTTDTKALESLEYTYLQDISYIKNLVMAYSQMYTVSSNLYVVTSNAQQVKEEDTINYKKGWLTGFVQALTAEQQKLKPTLIDFNNENHKENALQLVTEAKNPSTFNSIAYRDGQRYLPVFKKQDIIKSAQNDLPLKENGVYIVTGGLGGVGIIISQWLIETQNAKLLVIGRTDLESNSIATDDSRIKNLKLLQALSDTVIYKHGDITDEKFLKNCKTIITETWQQSINGILHLAGEGNLTNHFKTINNHYIINEAEQYYNNVMSPKAEGALQLHKLIEDEKDALYIAFSSVMSHFGGATFSAYAGANSNLDAFCNYRLAKGYKNTYCLNWSSWDNIGMSRNINITTNLISDFKQISKVNGIYSLILALQSNIKHLFIGLNQESPNKCRLSLENKNIENVTKVYYETTTEVTKDTLKQTLKTKLSFIDKDYVNRMDFIQVDSIPLNNGEVDFKQLHASHSNNKRVQLELPETEVQKTLCTIYKDILDARNVGVNSNFFELGGNSLQATMLIVRINKNFEVDVSQSDFYSNPTVSFLAKKIEELLETKDEEMESILI
jgi:acyl-CoA synthetase (AMP-forming)/AMP-acid ligase II/acyl carrier protein